jgi:hypothetical protein
MNIDQEKKHLDQVFESLNARFDAAYEKIKQNHILKIKRRCKLSYDDAKVNLQKYKTANFLYFYEIYCALLETECNIKNSLPNAEKIMETVLLTQNGYRWIKIIGGNKMRIVNSIDEDFYGNYSVLNVVKKFKDFSEKSSYLPAKKKPELVVVFYEELPNETKEEIEKIGIIVKSFNDLPLPQLNPCKDMDSIHLDVSTLITLCSELTNLDENIKNEDIIKRIWDKIKCYDINDVHLITKYKKELLGEILSYGDKIYVCQDAWDTFKLIVNTNGLKNEKSRFLEIEKFVTIVKNNPVERFAQCTSIQSDLYKNIFGTAESMNSIVYTGNTSFINNIESLGFHVNVKIHKSFQLAEKVLQLK